MDELRQTRLVGSGPEDGRLAGVKCGLISLGCAKNLVDAETMLGLIASSGGEITNDPRDADVIIVNTCGFLTDAKQESVDSILEMAELKAGRCRALIVAGCMAQRHGDDIALHIPEADAILGVGQVPQVVDVICRVLGGARVHDVEVNEYIYDFPLPRLISTGSHMAYVKISDGCSNRCTYCVIPSIRGPHRSRPMESIVDEVRVLAESGTREIILIAQDTTRYGEDIYGREQLPELLRRLVQIEALVWLRVMYMHPDRITEELLDVIASNEAICRYVDMPLQHAHPDVLGAMNRSGSPEAILDLVSRIRAKVPGVTLRTTFIVGFPGETQEQFHALEGLVSAARFDRAGVFEYSREEGTVAASLPGQVPKRTKKRRRDELMSLQQGISLRSNQLREGTVAEVILEAPCHDSTGRWYGRTRSEAPEVDGKVILSVDTATGASIVPGDLVLARLDRALEYDMEGEVLRSIGMGDAGGIMNKG